PVTRTSASSSSSSAPGAARRSRRDDLDAAAHSLAARLGGHSLELRQREVDHAAVARAHGLERDGAAGLNRALGLALGQRGEALVVTLAVIAGVDDDVPLLLGVAVHDAVEEKLERVEGLPLLADGAPRLGA